MTINHLESYLISAKRTITLEQEAINGLYDTLDHHFSQACHLLANCTGRIIITGIGKSGHIGRKIAATLSSTGNPAFFIHAGEANHGDMGMITHNDIALILSHSGMTKEVLTLLPFFKRVGVKILSMTSNASSDLAKNSDIHLHIKISKEACPLDLAPTSSTTAALVLGDAIAMALLEQKGFTHEDFAFSHPAGSLGKKLLLKVSDIMHIPPHIPIVHCGDTLGNALIEMSSKNLGMTSICDNNESMIGIFTDGDLRRAIDHGANPKETIIDEIMTKNYITISKETLAAEALKIMQEKKINGLFCLDANKKPVGAFNMLNLINAGIL